MTPPFRIDWRLFVVVWVGFLGWLAVDWLGRLP